MSKLFYIEYGCSCCSDSLIVSTNDFNTALQRAIEYAQHAATDAYFSYEHDYADSDDYSSLSEEELLEIEQEEMEYDIFYSAVPYDPSNEDHVTTLEEQNNEPFEI